MKNTVTAVMCLALVASVAGNIAQGIAMQNQTKTAMLGNQPAIMVKTPTSLENEVYGAPDKWLWHVESRGVSRQRNVMSPDNTPDMTIAIQQLRDAIAGKDFTTQIALLLDAYLKHRSEWVAVSYRVFSDGGVYCDENSAMFRNILIRLGIASRVVVFNFDDGDGGESHTALEAWNSTAQKWQYVDPHYGAYDTRSIVEIASGDHLPGHILIPANQNILNITFNRGAHELMFENYTPRQRYIFRGRL